MNVRNPRITSATMALVRKAVSCAGFSVKPRKYSAVPTSPAASPPNACERAVRCGTAVRGTRDRGTPTTNPAPIASTIQPWCTMAGWNQVARTATSIPATPATTAWRAVFGSFIQYREKMNSAVARMAASWSTAYVIAS